MVLQKLMRAHAGAAFVVLFAAGCGAVPGDIAPPADKDEPAAEAERPLADYLHDLSPRIEGVTRENATLEHYTIPTASGVTLDGWVRRPPGEEQQPLVVVISPYYGGGDPSSAANVQSQVLTRDPSWSGFAEFLIPHGYAVGFISVGGTGNSGGCFRNGGAIERKQLYDAVEFMATQPWSNGAVASIGVSYDGTTANELFIDAPPALKTVVPMEAISDFYRYSFNNGMRRGSNSAFTAYYYPVVGLNNAGLEGGVGPTDAQGAAQQVTGEPCTDQASIQAAGAYSAATGDKTPSYWGERDGPALLWATLDRPRPSMFYIQGYGDGNVDPQMNEGWLAAVRATGVPFHLWQGQWGHTYPQSTASECQKLKPCRGDFFELALLAWFDQFLKGIDTGILDAPPVQTQADDGIWRYEDDWPPSTVVTTDLHPTTENGFADAPAASGSVAYTDDTAAAQAGTGIVFVSAPLAAPLRLTGMARLETLATADQPKAGIVATLMERSADGRQRYLSFAALSLNHARDLGVSEPDVTGKPLPVGVNFFEQDNVLAAGSQLVLHIGGNVAAGTAPHPTAGEFLNTGPNLMPIGMGAQVQLELRHTRLRLPVNAGDRREPLAWLADDDEDGTPTSAQ